MLQSFKSMVYQKYYIFRENFWLICHEKKIFSSKILEFMKSENLLEDFVVYTVLQYK